MRDGERGSKGEEGKLEMDSGSGRRNDPGSGQSEGSERSWWKCGEEEEERGEDKEDC